jgi:hypothetical protein
MNGARDLAAEIDTVRRELRSLRDEAHDLGVSEGAPGGGFGEASDVRPDANIDSG